METNFSEASYHDKMVKPHILQKFNDLSSPNHVKVHKSNDRRNIIQ